MKFSNRFKKRSTKKCFKKLKESKQIFINKKLCNNFKGAFLISEQISSSLFWAFNIIAQFPKGLIGQNNLKIIWGNTLISKFQILRLKLEMNQINKNNPKNVKFEYFWFKIGLNLSICWKEDLPRKIISWNTGLAFSKVFNIEKPKIQSLWATQWPL